MQRAELLENRVMKAHQTLALDLATDGEEGTLEMRHLCQTLEGALDLRGDLSTGTNSHDQVREILFLHHHPTILMAPVAITTNSTFAHCLPSGATAPNHPRTRHRYIIL